MTWFSLLLSPFSSTLLFTFQEVSLKPCMSGAISPNPQTVGTIPVVRNSVSSRSHFGSQMLTYVTLGKRGEWLFSVFCIMVTRTSSFYISGLYFRLLPSHLSSAACVPAAAKTSVHSQCLTGLVLGNWLVTVQSNCMCWGLTEHFHPIV